jgi:hypothetical protein
MIFGASIVAGLALCLVFAQPAFACDDGTSITKGCAPEGSLTEGGAKITQTRTQDDKSGNKDDKSASSELKHGNDGGSDDKTTSNIDSTDDTTTDTSGNDDDTGTDDVDPDDSSTVTIVDLDEDQPGCGDDLLCIERVLDDGSDEENAEHVVTITDVEEFEPRSGTTASEPDGWTVTDLDTNFFSSAKRQTLVGELFGDPVAVRFTPYQWRWDYGDGEVLETASAGSSWADLGLPEFSETPTSHVYVRAGTFTVELEIDVTAEYRFEGEEWEPVDGFLTLDSAPITVTAGSAKTVLVGKDCTDSGSSAGC